MKMNETEKALAKALDQITAEVHSAARKNGWWNDREMIVDVCHRHTASLGEAANAIVTISTLGLINSEAGEAVDFARSGDGPDDKLPQYRGVDVELVDIVIRSLDMLGKRGAPVGEILMAKLKKNRERGWKHGGKLA